jgi:drug/metabolite transporter (DMT)-like permease
VMMGAFNQAIRRLPLWSVGLAFALLWGMGPVATKLSLRGTGPFTISSLRLLVAGGLFVAWLYRPGSSAKSPSRKQLPILLVLGILNTGFYLGAFAFAVTLVPPGLVSLFVAINPVMLAGITAVWLGRNLTRGEVTGMLIGLGGLLVVFLPRLQSHTVSLLGLVVLSAALVAFSFGSAYLIKTRIGEALGGLVINGWQNLIGGVLLLPLALWIEHFQITWNASFVIGALWLTVANSVASMLLLHYIMRVDPLEGSKWLLPPPLFGVLAAVIILGEKLSWTTLIGGAILLVGLAWMQLAKNHRATRLPKS